MQGDSEFVSKKKAGAIQVQRMMSELVSMQDTLASILHKQGDKIELTQEDWEWSHNTPFAIEGVYDEDRDVFVVRVVMGDEMVKLKQDFPDGLMETEQR